MARGAVSKPGPGPDWPVVGIAAAGLAVSAYLAWTKWTGAAAAFCERGSGCDVVQASRYATFLGAPTAAWGVVLYAVLIGLALVGLTPRRWVGAYALSVAAVAFSAYLTYLALWELRAVCPYCLADAGIAVALLATPARNPWHGGCGGSSVRFPRRQGTPRRPCAATWASNRDRHGEALRAHHRDRSAGGARASPRRVGRHLLRRLLVTRVQRATGPVRVCGGVAPVRGV